MSPSLAMSTTMGNELTLIAAHDMPTIMNMIVMNTPAFVARKHPANPNILIDLFGILAARHDALHHAEHHRTIDSKQPLAGGSLMLQQVTDQDG